MNKMQRIFHFILFVLFPLVLFFHLLPVFEVSGSIEIVDIINPNY